MAYVQYASISYMGALPRLTGNFLHSNIHLFARYRLWI
jgi:hypothetical protein